MAYFYLIIGVLLLLFGGDFLVRGAVAMALRMKISVLVVGMTVVSFATSAPELIVSLNAAFEGHSDISFGNVIGSNIANIALILGLTAMFFPLAVSKKTYRVDWLVMMVVQVVLFLFIFWDGVLCFGDAAILVAMLVVYNIYQIRSSRKEVREAEPDEDKHLMKVWKMVGYLLVGIAGLKFGSDFLVDGAVSLAQAWGVSERVIGITVVSIGTSLPELAASLVAAFKGEQDLSIGNLIGSNIFNVLAVLGLTGMVIDLPVDSKDLLTFDFPWLMGISLILYPLMALINKGEIGRGEGLLLFLAYITYILWVFL